MSLNKLQPVCRTYWDIMEITWFPELHKRLKGKLKFVALKIFDAIDEIGQDEIYFSLINHDEEEIMFSSKWDEGRKIYLVHADLTFWDLCSETLEVDRE